MTENFSAPPTRCADHPFRAFPCVFCPCPHRDPFDFCCAPCSLERSRLERERMRRSGWRLLLVFGLFGLLVLAASLSPQPLRGVLALAALLLLHAPLPRPLGRFLDGEGP